MFLSSWQSTGASNNVEIMTILMKSATGCFSKYASAYRVITQPSPSMTHLIITWWIRLLLIHFSLLSEQRWFDLILLSQSGLLPLLQLLFFIPRPWIINPLKIKAHFNPLFTASTECWLPTSEQKILDCNEVGIKEVSEGGADVCLGLWPRTGLKSQCLFVTSQRGCLEELHVLGQQDTQKEVLEML